MRSLHFSSALRLLLLLLHTSDVFSLDQDGYRLLSFKYSVTSDPLSLLANWNESQTSACSWNGVVCHEAYLHVTSLILPNGQLQGSIPAEMGTIEHLHTINLSNNSINGSLPETLFKNPHLKTLDFSNNMISGVIPAFSGNFSVLVYLNLSDNFLTGKLPANLSAFPSLKVLSLRNNYIAGALPDAGLVQVLDLSCNLLNGSIPSFFGGERLSLLNVSSNQISGEIPATFPVNIPLTATVDISHNNLEGKIPESRVFINQGTSSFSGNALICGEPANVSCNGSTSSPAAIAAIPEEVSGKRKGFRKAAVAGIVVGDLAGVLTVVLGFVFILRRRKKGGRFSLWPCLKESVEMSESEDGQESKAFESLVTINGDKELEVDTLLRASAFMLGAAGSGITYKAVLEDGSAFAVRRIGGDMVLKFRDFENQVKKTAKLMHPNLNRVLGFYWSSDDKLIISDFVPNGSLADGRHRKMMGSSSSSGSGSYLYYVPWQLRLKIAKGVARALAYLHEKKHVHGNLKPSNILLEFDFEPKVTDFGLDGLIPTQPGWIIGGSMRNFGSKRSTGSKDSIQDGIPGLGPSPSPSGIGSGSAYLPPESLRSLRPNAKWDVYAFGVVLLELLTGKAVVLDGMVQGTPAVLGEHRSRVTRLADVSIRADVEGKDDVLLSCFELGFNCASPVPQKRPSMKEAVQVLEKIPSIPSRGYG